MTSDKLPSRKQIPLEAGEAFVATLANLPRASVGVGQRAGGGSLLPGSVVHDGITFSESLVAIKVYEAAVGSGCSVFGITAALAAAAVVRAADTDTDAEPRKALMATEIVGGKLVVSIGVEALADAVARSPALNGSRVVNPDGFARDLLDRLGDGDDETGLSLIQHAIDDAAGQAAERGSKNIVCPEDD